jgi:thiamine kinase-like enzyme
VITAVAGFLRRFHGTPPLSHAFDAFRVPGQHLAAATARGVARPAAYDRVAEIVAEIADAFAVSPDPRRPSHNDLLGANLLDDGERLWLLDWEYAGMNDPSFDLGNFAVNNDLPPDAEAELLRGYHGTITPRGLGRLRLMKLVSDAREAMWAVVQQAISTLDFDYASYAEERFGRLLANASAPGYPSLLADASTPKEVS